MLREMEERTERTKELRNLGRESLRQLDEADASSA
jgi:hypothetical protein